MAKSRVAPLKPITIPRLELTAALVSAKVSAFLQKELEYDEMKVFYWADSKVVLGYIGNDARRFHVFVSNRVQQIRDLTLPNQWRYVDTKSNPADIASRGMSAGHLISSTEWWNGPKFLWEPIDYDEGRIDDEIAALSPDDPETRKISSFAVQAQDDFVMVDQSDTFLTGTRPRKLLQCVCVSRPSSLEWYVERPLAQIIKTRLAQIQPATTLTWKILSTQRRKS